MENIKLTFWGTRGSFVQTNPNRAKYGLETACITIELDKEIIIFDCGSGIRNFNEYFYENRLQYKKLKLFITHYHHDHICGLPFANFIYDENVVTEIYGGRVNDKTVKDILNTVFNIPYFPISVLTNNSLSFFEVEENKIFDFGNIQICSMLLNHGDFCIGYKLILNDKVISLITDYEYHTDKNKEKLEEFIYDSDIVIMDSFYTKEDYKENWGHSTIEECIYLINNNKVKVGYLFHHNTMYTDMFLEGIEKNIQEKYPHILFARDNLILSI